jgi:hypothetical protein
MRICDDHTRLTYKIESEKSDKIREEARSLVGSILVVVAFLLAAGKTSVVNIKSRISLAYFIGVSLLLVSIIIVTIVLRFRQDFAKRSSL